MQLRADSSVSQQAHATQIKKWQDSTYPSIYPSTCHSTCHSMNSMQYADIVSLTSLFVQSCSTGGTYSRCEVDSFCNSNIRLTPVRLQCQANLLDADVPGTDRYVMGNVNLL